MLAASLCLVGALTGCRDDRAERTTPGVEDPAVVPARDLEPAQPAAVAEPKVGDRVPVGFDGGSVAVLAVDPDVNSGRLFSAGRGRHYYAVEVEGCSGPKEAGLSFSAGYFLLRAADARAFDPTLPIKRPELPRTDVPAGGCHSGWVTFEVPDDAAPVAVAYDGSSRITWTIPAATP